MGEADRDSKAAYNYPRFDEHVATGGDMADEDAFRASPWGRTAGAGFHPATARRRRCPVVRSVAVQAAGDGVWLVHLTVLLRRGSSA